MPYGVYDVGANGGWVSVGITSDTAEFAVQSTRRWRDAMGRERYPNMRELTITADCGGSNGARVRFAIRQVRSTLDESNIQSALANERNLLARCTFQDAHLHLRVVCAVGSDDFAKEAGCHRGQNADLHMSYDAPAGSARGLNRIVELSKKNTGLLKNALQRL